MTVEYRPPVRDIELTLDVVGASELGNISMMTEVVGELGRYCADKVARLSRPGDVSGVVFDAGREWSRPRPVGGTPTPNGASPQPDEAVLAARSRR